LSVLFLYDPETDELEARHTLGDLGHLLAGLRIPLGQRLSGWVAANRKTIANSDPLIDLGEVARVVDPRLRSCLSTPLVLGDQLIGVLSLYSAQQDAFADDHRRVIEVVARQISQTFKSAAEFDNEPRRDALTGLPSVGQLERLLQFAMKDGGATSDAEVMLLFMDIEDLRSVNLQYGRTAGDDVLRHVARHAKGALRVGDILFRHRSDEFVALLNATDLPAAESVAERVRQNLQSNPLHLKSGFVIPIEIRATCVSAPRHGRSMGDLTSAAQIQISAREGRQTRRVH
jgi:diguanylate cyclase (GGDEF)-like protein